MQSTWLVPMVLLLTHSSCSKFRGANTDECSVDIAARAATQDTLDDGLIRSLLSTGTPLCRSNVEFMETFNEAVFRAAGRNTDGFIREFSRSTNQEFILQRLESPVSDAIELPQIIDRVTRSPAHAESRERILKALRIAAAKS